MGGWYTRFAVDAFGHYNSKKAAVHLHEHVSLRTNSGISQPIVFQRNAPFVHGAKRFYCAGETAEGSTWWKNVRDFFKLEFEIVPSSAEQQLGEILLEEKYKPKYEGKFLSTHDPKSIRLQKIMQKIVEAHEHRQAIQTRAKGQKLQFKWEVFVVCDPSVTAFSWPGGKVVVFTGLLEHFPSDAEIATIIGHEVGHAVARHIPKGIDRSCFCKPDFVERMSEKYRGLITTQRMELEADYIGLLLMASTGYQPQVAVRRTRRGFRTGNESSEIRWLFWTTGRLCYY